MSHPIATRTRFDAAHAAVLSRNEEPTYEALRREMGGGSLETIARLRREHERVRAVAANAPLELPRSIETKVRNLARTLLEEVETRFKEDLRRTDEVRENMATLGETIAIMEHEAQERQRLLSEALATNIELMESAKAAESAASRSMDVCGMKIQLLQGEVTKLRAELDAVSKKLRERELMLEEMKSR